MGKQARINKMRKQVETPITSESQQPSGELSQEDTVLAQAMDDRMSFVPPEYLSQMGKPQLTDTERRFSSEVARLEMLLVSEKNRARVLKDAIEKRDARVAELTKEVETLTAKLAAKSPDGKTKTVADDVHHPDNLRELQQPVAGS